MLRRDAKSLFRDHARGRLAMDLARTWSREIILGSVDVDFVAGKYHYALRRYAIEKIGAHSQSVRPCMITDTTDARYLFFNFSMSEVLKISDNLTI